MKSLMFFLVSTFSISAFANQGHQHESVAHLVYETLGIHAHVYWEIAPSLTEAAVMKVEFRRASDHELTDITQMLSVRATMPGMDHGDVPTAAPVRKLDEAGQPIVGTLLVGNVFFYHAGLWRLILTLTAADGSAVSQSFDYTMPGEGGHQH